MFFTATDKESGVKDARESPLRCEQWPSCEFKSISETPRSLTWHEAVLFPWLGCRYLPTIPQDHGASLSQLCSDSLAFDIVSYWSLPRQTGSAEHLCCDKHNQLYLSVVFSFFLYDIGSQSVSQASMLWTKCHVEPLCCKVSLDVSFSSLIMGQR